jgi:hypothetical protein
LAANAPATAAERAMTTKFSCNVHESVVQFVEPVHTASPSRTTYLWCIRSGTPGTPQVGNGSASTSSGSVRGGGGKMRSSWSAL